MSADEAAASSPYASSADTWQGWEAEIAIHSAGLEQYTAPTAAGQPGITSLTAAGAAALGLDPGGTYIETYSWGAPVEVSLKPLAPGSVTLYGMDFTDLANAILRPIQEALNPILSTVQNLLNTVGGKVIDALTPITEGLISTINGILASIGRSGADIGKLLDTTYATLKKSIDTGLRDLEDVFQKAWAQALTDINEVLRLARQIDNGLGDIVINTEELAGNMTRRFDKLDGSLQQWVPDAVLGALLRALDLAVSR